MKPKTVKPQLNKVAIAIVLLFINLVTLSFQISAQGVGINNTGNNADGSAGLDISFTDKGMLIPRMTTSQRDGISSAANSLFIFNTTDNCFQVRNSASGQWENMYCFSGCTSAPGSPTANTATNIGEESFDANWTLSSGATNYYIDVDDNSDFSSPLAGYNNFDVGNAITLNVTGLTCGTTYYYRVRANNDCGTSANSNSITVVYPSACPVNCLAGPTTIVDVVSGGGATWMDRNLGASQVATSSTDALAYGDMYQWGRFSDGHQCRTSSTTSTVSNTDTPGHGNFITRTTSPWDWRSPTNSGLWQGVSGINNPCPTGYRLATGTEWSTEISSWSSADAAGALASPLKMSLGGYRNTSGSITNVGTRAHYWSSTVSFVASIWQSKYVTLLPSSANVNDAVRGEGQMVRCIKN